MKALNHGVQKSFRSEPIEIDRVAGEIGKECEKADLSAAVAFAERMYGIEGRQEMRRGSRESLRRQPLEIPLSFEIGEEPLRLTRDVLRVAKCAAVFAEAYRPELACPGIDILEQMMMDGSIMANAEAPLRQWFVGPLGSTHSLEFSQCIGVANVGNVSENSGVRIAVRVCYGVIVGGPSGPSHTFC